MASSVTPRNVFVADHALAALRDHGGYMTTKEVAAAIGGHPAPWNTETWRMLDRLARLGRVTRVKVSGQLVQWKAATPAPITVEILDPFLDEESPRDN